MPKKNIAEQHMVMDRQTKGAVLYKARNDNPKMQNIYIRKSALPEPFPGDITVTISVDVSEEAGAQS